MSGEILFRIVDVEHYARVVPLLDLLRGPTPPSTAVLAVVEAALACSAASLSAANATAEVGRRLLERIVQGRSVTPRWFLSPAELDAATHHVVSAMAFVDAGVWTSRRPGPSWVVVERLFPHVLDALWFDPLLYARSSVARPLPYPRGETTTFLVTPEATQSLHDGLATIAPDGAALAEHQGLSALTGHVLAAPSWGLVVESLL